MLLMRRFGASLVFAEELGVCFAVFLQLRMAWVKIVS